MLAVITFSQETASNISLVGKALENSKLWTMNAFRRRDTAQISGPSKVSCITSIHLTVAMLLLTHRWAQNNWFPHWLAEMDQAFQGQQVDMFCFSSSNINSNLKQFQQLANRLPCTHCVLLNYSLHSLSECDSSFNSNAVFMRQSIHDPCLHDSQLVASQTADASLLVLHIHHMKDHCKAR